MSEPAARGTLGMGEMLLPDSRDFKTKHLIFVIYGNGARKKDVVDNPEYAPYQTKLIPEGIVRELAYTGRRLGARRAKEIGLVNEVYPSQDAMLQDVMLVAREIAERSPLAVWGSKEMLNYSRDHAVADSLNYIATWQTGMFQPTDMAESFQAQTEKRKPHFQDLPRLRRGL